MTLRKSYNAIDYFNADADERRDYAGIWTYSDSDGEPSREIYENLAICQQRDGRYYLIVERSEFVTDDLAEVEAILLDWARNEGYDV